MRLQWGRRSSSTERMDGEWYTAEHNVLQWGRRSSSTERYRPLASSGWSATRFNGAVDRRRRRAKRDPVRHQHRAASMGPSIVVDGEGRCVKRGTADDSMLQWGRRSSSTESLECITGNGVHHVLQWGRRSSSMERSAAYGSSTVPPEHFNGAVDRRRRRARGRAPGRHSGSSFNGAVDRRRRRALRIGSPRSDSTASMGPSIVVDGEKSPAPMSTNIW